MHYLVYKITHIPSGKYYIGAHATKNKHDSYMGSGKYIKHAIAKHGTANFVKEIIVECFSATDMYAVEKELVIIGDDTYNTMPGGKGGWDYVNAGGLNGSTSGVTTRVELLSNKEWYDKWKSAQTNGTRRHALTITHEEYSRRGSIANESCLQRTGKYSFSGKQHSAITKQVISEKAAKRNAGIGNPMAGRMWITDGVTSVTIIKDSLIPDGWRRGRK